jgi:methyltransferase (TIGR00027 family)
MTNNGVEKKHSKTAMMAVLYRAIHNIEYNNEKYGSDYLAKYFLFDIYRWLIKTQFFRTMFKTKSESLTPGIYGYVLARTAFFDEIFKTSIENGYNQIVLLGAGYDSRAYRFSDLSKYYKYN